MLLFTFHRSSFICDLLPAHFSVFHKHELRHTAHFHNGDLPVSEVDDCLKHMIGFFFKECICRHGHEPDSPGGNLTLADQNYRKPLPHHSVAGHSDQISQPQENLSLCPKEWAKYALFLKGPQPIGVKY